MKFGVISFPGSCDDVDAVMACARVGNTVRLWHADHDLSGADVVVIPGGFSYGDYLRAGAIARFAPIMTEVIEFAREGGFVMGICNGFQVCCEAGLLPGALLTNISRRFVCRQVGAGGRRPHRVHARARPSRDAVDPGQAHDRALFRAARDARADECRRPGRAPLRARPEP